MTSTTILTLETEMKDRLQRIAELQHRPAEVVLQEAVAEYVDRQERRERMDQDTVASREEFERTGLHLTGEEVDEWLTNVAGGSAQRLPKCHL